MKILIFKSQVTDAVYLWNGNETICIKEGSNRPVGKIMKGITNAQLGGEWEISRNSDFYSFKVGEASYTVLKNLFIKL